MIASSSSTFFLDSFDDAAGPAQSANGSTNRTWFRPEHLARVQDHDGWKFAVARSMSRDVGRMRINVLSFGWPAEEVETGSVGFMGPATLPLRTAANRSATPRCSRFTPLF
jgi:hypothetical protein